MIYELTAGAGEVKIKPANELEEIAQNILTIITTAKMSAPLDRGFGISAAMLDAPISASQAKVAAEVVSAVKEFEPRAQITNVIFDGEFSEGKLNFRVQFKLVENKRKVSNH